MSCVNKHRGGSTIGLIIMLAVFGYGAYVGIQYVPLYIESNNVDTVLQNLVDKNRSAPFNNMSSMQSAIDNQLFVNNMADLKSSFSVRRYQNAYEITVRYERALNLLYEEKVLKYEKRALLK